MSEAPTTFPRYDAGTWRPDAELPKPAKKYPLPKVKNYSFNSLRAVGEALNKSVRIEGAGDTDNYREFCAMQYREAKRICNAGGSWLEGARNLQRIKVPAIGIQRQIKAAMLEAGPVGFAPNVGAYCANLPDSMLNFEDVATPRPVIKIEVNATIAHDVTDEQAYNRGRAILAVVKALESQGVSVEVSAYMCSGKHNRLMRVDVPLKSANEALSAAKLAFALCNAAFVRRVYCRLMECDAHCYEWSADTYGSLRAEPSGQADIHIGGMSASNAPDSPQHAVDAMMTVILEIIKKKKKAA